MRGLAAPGLRHRLGIRLRVGLALETVRLGLHHILLLLGKVPLEVLLLGGVEAGGWRSGGLELGSGRLVGEARVLGGALGECLLLLGGVWLWPAALELLRLTSLLAESLALLELLLLLLLLLRRPLRSENRGLGSRKLLLLRLLPSLIGSLTAFLAPGLLVLLRPRILGLRFLVVLLGNSHLGRGPLGLSHLGVRELTAEGVLTCLLGLV